MSYICKECHENIKGCCRFFDEPNSIEIGISLPEAYKISQATGLEIDQFLQKDNIDSFLVDSLARTIHPIFNKIFYKGIRYKLKTIDNNCVFLTEAGCKLEKRIRPFYCNLYPFWLMPDEDRLRVLINHECLAQQRAANISDLLKMFGINRNDIINEFYSFEETLSEHVRIIESNDNIII